MGKTILPAVPKIAMNTLADMFYGSIKDFEKQELSFSKQLAIKQCFERLQTFIRNRSYSDFEIRVMSTDNEEIILTLLFNNYTLVDEVESIAPSQFVIQLYPSFSEFDVFVQSESTGNLISVKL